MECFINIYKKLTLTQVFQYLASKMCQQDFVAIGPVWFEGLLVQTFFDVYTK